MSRKRPAEECPNRLRSLRETQGLTLEEVGQRSGISFANVSKIEVGDRHMRLWHMKALAKVYKVLPADLFLADQGGLTSDERYLIETYRDLPPSLQKTFDVLCEHYQEFRGLGMAK